MRHIQIFLFFMLLAIFSYAEKIPSPPPLKDSPPALQHYLETLYDNINSLEVVTSNPDGTRNGEKGDMLLLQTGGTSYLEINTDSSTTWRGVALADTP